MPLPSGFEWIVILVIALLILGPGRLPDVAASVGKSIREFRKASSDVQDAVKIDTSPLPATPAPPGPQVATPNVLQSASTPNELPPRSPDAPGQPTQTHPTPQSSGEPVVEQPIAPIAPTSGQVSPVVTAPDDPQPVADSAPTDTAPKADG
jgi:TatA/E family protein of Tat protein translocase